MLQLPPRRAARRGLHTCCDAHRKCVASPLQPFSARCRLLTPGSCSSGPRLPAPDRRRLPCPVDGPTCKGRGKHHKACLIPPTLWLPCLACSAVAFGWLLVGRHSAYFCRRAPYWLEFKARGRATTPRPLRPSFLTPRDRRSPSYTWIPRYSHRYHGLFGFYSRLLLSAFGRSAYIAPRLCCSALLQLYMVCLLESSPALCQPAPEKAASGAQGHLAQSLSQSPQHHVFGVEPGFCHYVRLGHWQLRGSVVVLRRTGIQNNGPPPLVSV